MRIGAFALIGFAGAALATTAGARADEARRQPFEMVRTLQAVQDQIAHGSLSANDFQKKYIVQLNDQLRRMPTDVWGEPRNARAAVVFVLSGGDPRLLKELQARQPPLPVDANLVKAAVAFGEASLPEASTLLDDIEPRTLEPALAGLVALIKGTLLIKSEPKKAIACFDDARLLSPGTLIEESALRQEILLVARDGNLARFDQLLSQYSRRFANSIYAPNFRRQFFAGVARQDFKGTAEWISRTEAEMQKMPVVERSDAYLSLAEEATLGGNVEIARYAAENAKTLTEPGSVDHERAILYEGATAIVSGDYDDGHAQLKSITPERLGYNDKEVLAASLGLANQLHHWPETASDAQNPPVPVSVTKAEKALSNLDAILAGSPK